MRRFLCTIRRYSSPIGIGAMPRELDHAAASSAGRRMAIGLAVMFVSLQLVLCAQADSIIVPGVYETTEGTVALSRANVPPSRFQQLYEAAEFSSLGGPVLITGYMARPHALQSGPAGISVADLDYWLSTTSRTVSTLSPVFAENRGTDHTLVASHDPIVVYTTANVPGPAGTKQFDVVQMFSTPFRYDPAEGNLLLEVRTEGTTLISGSEFVTSACSLGTSCRTRMVIFNGSADATAGQLQSFGEINLFLYEPISEVAGDYNNDGSVDAADYVVWRKNEGTTNVLLNDALGGTIDERQFDQWRANFGTAAGSGTSSPEPATLVLLTFAAAALWPRRVRAA